MGYELFPLSQYLNLKDLSLVLIQYKSKLEKSAAEWKKFFSTNISMEYNVQASSWISSLCSSAERGAFRHWRGDREEGENEGWPVGIYDAVQGTSAPHRHCSASTAGGKATATSGV